MESVVGRLTVLSLALWLGTSLHAQPSVPSTVLGSRLATSGPLFGSIAQIVPLSDGRVFVNDPQRKQVVLLSANLVSPTVVLDSLHGPGSNYGTGTGPLLPFFGDSVLFVDRTSKALLVIAPNGTIARTIAQPSAPAFLVGVGASVWFSRTLGLVYTVTVNPMFSIPASAAPHVGVGDPDVAIRYDDSSTVVAMNIVTRKIDTLARMNTGRAGVRVYRANGSSGTTEVTPFPVGDQLVVASDGALAVLRPRTLTITRVTAPGLRVESGRIPYDWKPIGDTDRQRLLDSINAFRAAARADTLERFRRDSLAAAAVGARLGRTVPVSQVLPREIPDYWPAVGLNASIAGPDGALWIRLGPPAGGPSSYGIVSSSGSLTSRIAVPFDRTVVGIVPGAVFLLAHDGGAASLEKVRF